MASIEDEQSHLIFLPFAPFEPLNSGEELPLSVGRPVLLLNRDESPDWWFGRDVEDGREVRVCVWIECSCKTGRLNDRLVGGVGRLAWVDG